MAKRKSSKGSLKAIKKAGATKPVAMKPAHLPRNENGVAILSGGNPQIAKGDGDGPVQAYIANMPLWNRAFGQQLDALIVDLVPNVRKAVKWNSPFYGVPGQGWFLSFHVFAKYLKIVFFSGAKLRPIPPVESKDPNVRYFHIYEGDELDQQQMSAWLKQAAALPGWMAG